LEKKEERRNNKEEKKKRRKKEKLELNSNFLISSLLNSKYLKKFEVLSRI